ncbi:di-trans,poly-cis-decaprenylcistransferase [Streptomyces adustus]|uniref:Isoprenyl transferase n=1 Tax=Streptomyces adustus TaxID=1609272 RepID=A0A5N8VUP3_9ACTN|nr:di-trans,poly-cis-decaprenylcistransferase [Streptomyces adustus]
MAAHGNVGHRSRQYRTPEPHPSGARAPKIPGELIPNHVAIVMDGNGRWAKERGLPRTDGHTVGGERVLEVLQGAIEIGVENVSLYAFSTENWKRSPDEVRFLMNFNRSFIRRTRDILDELGVRVCWVGRTPKLWKSVAKELQVAQEQTKGNDRLTLYFCMNYGGRAEVADAVKALAADVAAGRLDPDRVSETTLQRYMYYPGMPDVDLFLRPSGEQRTSNFLLWQSAYAGLVFQDVLWPDFDRRDLWRACLEFASRGGHRADVVPSSEATAVDQFPGHPFPNYR